MTKHDDVDVLVIGSGMGGAAATMMLAGSGIRVVCLEQGRWVAEVGHPHTERDYEWQHVYGPWNPAPNARKLPEDYPIETNDEVPQMWNGVGGSTVHYGAVWPRYRPSDFRKGTEHGYAPDWPFSYEDLEPFYDQNDKDCGISGWRGNPAMPPRQALQTQPLPFTKFGEPVIKGLNALGWHWWICDAGIIAEDYKGRTACNHCGNCDSGCPRGSLGDVSVTHMPRALAAGAELRTNSRVERIEVDSEGRATGAVYIDLSTGVRHFQPADIIIVACNGIGTPRLLLNSTSNRFPQGLANRNDVVGRNLMHHGFAVVKIWTEQVRESYKGSVAAVITSSEFVETDVKRGFINGLTMHMRGLRGAGAQAAGTFYDDSAPWGVDHHQWFQKRFGHGFIVSIIGEDLPLPDNRVRLSQTLTDSSGIPAPHVDYKMTRNDWQILGFGVERALELADAVDAFDVRVNRYIDPVKGYQPPAFHLLGSCRMGNDPETSVVNQWHQTWDVPNLYIMDGSNMVTSAAVNPTSTIGAMVVRAVTYLRENYTSARLAKRTTLDGVGAN